MIRHIREHLLATYLHDNTRAKLLMPDGSYVRAKPEANAAPRDSQAFFAAGHDTPPE
jgi:polyphosphate kinase